MLRVIFLALALCLACHPARATDAATGNEAVSPASAVTTPVAVSAMPGKGFGLNVTPSGATPGSPLVLEARLARPGDPVNDPPLRWMVAARAGAPVSVSWEFAYDWEIIPGVWTLKVFSEDVEIASAAFDVSRAEVPSSPGQTAQASPAKESAQPGREKTKADTTNNAKQSSSAKTAPAAQTSQSNPEPAAPGEASQAKPATAPRTPNPAPGQPQAQPQTPAHPPAQASPQTSPQAQASKPPRQDARLVGGPPERTLHVLVGGVYSEEARALWVTVFLSKQGVKACVREERQGQRRLWAVITGWKDTAEEARALKAGQAPVVGDIFLRNMTAAELEKGLECP